MNNTASPPKYDGHMIAFFIAEGRLMAGGSAFPYVHGSPERKADLVAYMRGVADRIEAGDWGADAECPTCAAGGPCHVAWPTESITSGTGATAPPPAPPRHLSLVPPETP
jgi:hypothetical protein